MNNRSIRLGAAVAFLVFFYTILLLFPQSANAATSYSYASNGSKIAVNYNGANYTLTKAPLPQGGKDDYRGVIKIAWTGGNQCNLGIQVLVSSGSSSGTVASPAFLNGIPGVGSPGSNTTPSCPKDFAQSRTEFNQSISISGSPDDNTGPPAGSETDAQKQAIVTAYSPTKTPPSASVSMTQLGQAGSQTKTLNWNGSVGSVRWSSIAAGTQLRFCITPPNVFDTQSCKTVTKQRGKTLLVDFGSFENSYNEDGKKVIVTVNFKVANAPQPTTYGPIPLTIYNSAGEAKGTASTKTNTYGDEDNGGVTPAQNGSLEATFNNVNPGRYKVCVTGNNDICSPLFAKETNLSARTTINVSEEDSKNFLGEDETANSCVIEGVGWLVCPVIMFFANIADGAFGFLADSFLRTDPSAFNTDSPTYNAWSIMRSIANILFVIAFLVIIFSQLVGIGISNYGVKKMLPRLVIAAVLVNVSFFLSQLAVDLSNILGYSIRDVFDIVTKQIRGDSYGDVASVAATGNSLSNIAVGVLAFSGAVIALYALLSTFGALLIAAVVALLMILFILIARQAIIVLLVVLSPIAFVALLFPNTERFFKFWRKTFMAMLLLFPIIALVFGASALASGILQGSFTGAYNGEGTAWFRQIIAAAILILPLFIVPPLLKKAVEGIPMVGQYMGKLQNRADANFGSKLKDSHQGSTMARGAAIRKRARENYRVKKFADRLSDNSGVLGGFRRRVNRAVAGGVPILPADRFANKALIRSAEETANEALGKDVAAASQSMEGKLSRDDVRAVAAGGSATSIDNTKTFKGTDLSTRMAAMSQTVAANDIAGMNKLWDDSQTWKGPEGDQLRLHLARSIKSSSYKPSYFGAGALEQLRTNTHTGTNSQTLMTNAVAAGAYSPQTIAQADKDELAAVYNADRRRAIADPTYAASHGTKLATDAGTVMTDRQLNRTISKNRENISNISSGIHISDPT